KVNRVEGYRDGEIMDLPTNRALTYCRNGQAEPVGWEDENMQPMNRMLDTSQTNSTASRKKAAKKADKRATRKPKQSSVQSDSSE
ncbi:hypothetical protein LCGC14_1567860, partial [marine sediment metagenome]